jgi:membrane-associated phospholipid phosphatase
MDAIHLSFTLPQAAPVPRTSGAHGLDKTLFLDVNSFARQTTWLHTAMLAYAVTWGIVVCGALLVVGWWLARRRHDARVMAASLWAGAGTIAAVGVAQPINHAVAEGRPWESLPHALILAGHTTDFSFPSDHAVMAGAVIAGIFLYQRRLGIVALVAGLLLCFGRVYIGAHYPQDVAGGLLIGAAVVLIGWVIVRIPLTALVGYLSRTPLRPLLTSGDEPLPAPTPQVRPTGAHASGRAR